jgi:hypothetical protein
MISMVETYAHDVFLNELLKRLHVADLFALHKRKYMRSVRKWNFAQRQASITWLIFFLQLMGEKVDPSVAPEPSVTDGTSSSSSASSSGAEVKAAPRVRNPSRRGRRRESSTSSNIARMRVSSVFWVTYVFESLDLVLSPGCSAS